MQPNIYSDPYGVVISDDLYKSINGRDINIIAASFDQKHQLWGGELNSGLKYSMVDADNEFMFYDVVDDIDVISQSESSTFLYKEQIASAYLLFSHNIGTKFSLEAGLRGEYTLFDGTLKDVAGSETERNQNNYFNLFPSLSLSYQASESSTLSLNYGSRIDRPAYQDLNPFEYLLDELSFWQGNPFLLPQISHKITGTFSHKQTTVTLAYTYIDNYYASITDTLDVNKVVTTPKNLGIQQRASVSVFQSIKPVKWWDLNVNVIGYYVLNDIAFDEYRQFNLSGFAGIFSLQNNLRLPWRILMELKGSYTTRRLGASNEWIDPSGSVDVGFSRSFDEDKWRVSLAMTDVFATIRWDNSSSFDGLVLQNWGRGETRQVKLNVTYRFGRQKNVTHKSEFNEIDRL